MSLQNTSLTKVVQVPDAPASVYTNPDNCKTHVRGFKVHNTNATDEDVAIYWVQPSSGVGTASDAERIWKVTLAATETLMIEIPYGLVMTEEDESIQAESTTADMVNIVVLGDKDL